MTATAPARPVHAAPAAGHGPLPRAVVAGIGATWVLVIGAEVVGGAGALGHDRLIGDGGLPPLVALGLFLGAWQVMVAAMMLPSTLPMVRLFTAASAGQDRPGRALAAFLGGYGAVWTAFGAAAFVGDEVVHGLVGHFSWLEERPRLVAAAVLGLAGAFQFSGLKDRCLRTCRHPAAFLLSRYRRGVPAAFRLGREHGLFCLGCCWALMLVAFAVGVAQLWWMAVLTTVMTYEKVGRHGRKVTPIAGWGLLVGAAWAIVAPSWLS